jgi:DNA processing protein
MQASHARAVLARTPELEHRQLAAILAAAGGDPVQALAPALLHQAELSAAARQWLLSPDAGAIELDLAWLQASGVVIVLAGDAGYPPLLARMHAAPAALYVRGELAALSAPQLAMVGSRNPSAEGQRTAREFAAWFARAGLIVTSGLARGIDAAAHAGALRAEGSTIAVCGTGLDQVYPPEHGPLAARIAAHGALVSQIPPRTAARREHFERRNLLIAGLTLGTLVVEAARNSGALLAARLAADAGREVLAIPGSIHSPLSRGPHQLIKSGAKLVEEAADVLAELQISYPKEELTQAPEAPQKPLALDKEYEMLLDALGPEPASVESLVAVTRLPAESVASMLLILELEGRVAALPAGRYGRLP